MPKEYDCKMCGTMARSMYDDELIRFERKHMREYHKQRISKDEAAKALINVAA